MMIANTCLFKNTRRMVTLEIPYMFTYVYNGIISANYVYRRTNNLQPQRSYTNVIRSLISSLRIVNVNNMEQWLHYIFNTCLHLYIRQWHLQTMYIDVQRTYKGKVRIRILSMSLYLYCVICYHEERDWTRQSVLNHTKPMHVNILYIVRDTHAKHENH